MLYITHLTGRHVTSFNMREVTDCEPYTWRQSGPTENNQTLYTACVTNLECAISEIVRTEPNGSFWLYHHSSYNENGYTIERHSIGCSAVVGAVLIARKTPHGIWRAKL